MISVVSVILVLAVLILFHELGHFLAARSLGIGVSTFSLGFGPKLWKRAWGKTEYCLSLVPLGGYVSLVGEEDEADLPQGFSEAESFSRRPPWQRLLVAAAGPAANFLLAWLLCWGLAYGYGQTRIVPDIGAVEEGSPAAEAGLKPGDIVLTVNGGPVAEWGVMAEAIAASQGAPLHMEISRSGRGQTLTITPAASIRKNIFGEEEKTWRIGIRASGRMVGTELSFGAAAAAGMRRTWEMARFTWMGFVKLAQRAAPLDQVGGPIMIAQMVGQQAQEGLANVLALTALISVNLAVLNLLPIPVLDGGHILFCTLESLLRRPISRKIRLATTQAGFIFLIGLMALATFNDVWRIVKNWGGFGG